MKVALFLISIFVIAACKKKQPHELTGEKAIFVGTWHWVYSTHRHNYCDGGDVVTDTLTPETENHTFKIELIKEGIIKYYQDNEMFEEQSTFITTFEESIACSSLSGSIAFGIAFSYDADNGNISGCINNDTIRAYPFDDFLFPYTPGCEGYRNYFVKE